MTDLLGVQSAPVTDWPERLALTALVVAVIVLAIWAMRRSWIRRSVADADLRLDPVPAQLEAGRTAPGRYLGTSPAGQWMRRVVAAGLGAVGTGSAMVNRQGVLIMRNAEPHIWLSAADLVAVEIGRGIAGQVAEKDGVVLWTWHRDERTLTTGFRPSRATDVVDLVSATQHVIDTTTKEDA